MHSLARPLLWWLVFLAAWAVRLWQLDASDLTYDEVATYHVAHRPLLDILTYLRGAVREHPPVFYLLMRPWMSLAGTSEYSLRLFAAGASMLGIALTARLARTVARWLGTNKTSELAISAALPAIILACFPFEVNYARDARMYTLNIVWAVLSSLLFLPWLSDFNQGGITPKRRWPSRTMVMGLVLVNALALFTHYYLGFLIACQFVCLLLLRRWRGLLIWTAAHGSIALMGLAWLARSPGLSSSLSEAWGRFSLAWPTMGKLRRLLAELLFGPVTGVPWDLVYSWGALVALGLIVVWLRGIRSNRKSGPAPNNRDRALVVALWLSVSMLLPIALAFLMPEPPRSRYLIYVLPFAALALGQIPFISTAHKRVVATGLGFSILAVSILGFFGLPRTTRWIKSSYGHTIATISAQARPGDGVLFYGPWQWIQFHYYRPDNFPQAIATLPPRQVPPQLTKEEVERELPGLLEKHERLWVIPASVGEIDPAHFGEGWLNAHAHPVWTTQHQSLYLPPAAQEAISKPLEIAFGERLQLQHLTSEAQSVPAGEALRLTLTWMVSSIPQGDVKLNLSLVDERGNRWQHRESLLGQWFQPSSAWEQGDVIIDRQGLIVPQGTPPGLYTVRLTAIDADSGALIPPPSAPNALQRSIDLYNLEVTEPVTPPVLTEVGEFTGPFTFIPPQGSSDTLTLAAYDLGGLKFQQGNRVPLWLHWLAPSNHAPDLELRLQLQHRARGGLFSTKSTPIATETLSLAPGYPLAEWSKGRLVSLPIALTIPDNATPGRTDLTLAVVGADGQPWTVGDDPYLTLGVLTLEERPMLRQLPDDLTAVRIDFANDVGDQIGLRGYRVDGRIQPGGRLDLTYAWYTSSQPKQIYSVFNHLLTADGQKITQVDGWPQGGAVLTSQWRPGEYVRDNHTLEIPVDAPPGPYLLAVGLYDAANGTRMEAFFDGQPLPYNQWLLPLAAE